MGIELKGWYALAKESEPSFRHRVTPAVATEFDLLVVLPWALSDAIAGSPVLFRPYVVGARFAAAYRNYWWGHIKGGKGTLESRGVRLSSVTTNYPEKSELINDRPVSDSGNNFGRYSRTGLMDEYIAVLDAELLRGIPLGKWRGFLAQFTSDTD